MTIDDIYSNVNLVNYFILLSFMVIIGGAWVLLGALDFVWVRIKKDSKGP